MADGEDLRPPYWVAARLAAAARQHWHRFDGWCASRGVDPLDLPPDRFCNLVYYWLVRGLDEEKAANVDAQLEEPPSGEAVEDAPGTTWSAEQEMAQFEAAQRAASSLG